MSDDYQPPEGYVNPVPEPGGFDHFQKLEEVRAAANAPVSLPSVTSLGGLRLIHYFFIVIAILIAAWGPIRQAIDATKDQGARDAATANGKVQPIGSSVSATYQPADGEVANSDVRNAPDYSVNEWTLAKGDESIVVRDYRFKYSPVKDRATLKDYYASTARQLEMTAGHPTKPAPITIDGRKGRVWETRADNGRQVLLAEFPGDPHSVRMACDAASVESVVAAQCKQILRSLRFGE